MKLKRKLTAVSVGLLSATGTVMAHTGEENTTNGMWMDGSWMHGAGHMTGYNMGGMGWFGPLVGLTFWILAILGIVYLYQRIQEEGDKE